MSAETSEEELRRRYLDWCSTQVAKRFLELSLDEVWLRSHSAASLPSPAVPPEPLLDSSSGLDRIPNYLELVRKTALLLAQEMELPDFPEWRKRYLEDPAAYEGEILG